MTVNKVSTLFMTLIIAMSIVGLAYTHWSDTIRIEGTVKMAHIRMTIGSYKTLPDTNVTSELSADNHTLTLTCDGLEPCWFIWIGLVTQNQGSLPANVKPPKYSFDSDGFQDYFNTTEYFYGPYPENTGFGNLTVWGDVKVSRELLENGTVTFTTTPHPPPFIADPGEKVVIWIWIHCKLDIPDDAQGETVTMYINIADDIAI